MTTNHDFVTVDWRTGPDRIYFFHKDSNTYTRFNLKSFEAPDEYPLPIDGNWDSYKKPSSALRFGFTTTSPSWDGGIDTLWLFYLEEQTPWVCEYSQQTDAVLSYRPVSQSQWSVLLPFFNNIVGVMWVENSASGQYHWFLLNDGRYLIYELYENRIKVLPLKGSPWAELEQYSDRMMTAVTNDFPTFDTYFYVFLKDNKFLKYELESKKIKGPYPTDGFSWTGVFPE